MGQKKLTIAIVGAGIGGLTAASTLRSIGIDVQIYEQASRFARVGAGIQMMPNSMKVLRKIGIEEHLRRTAFQPYSHLNREWDTGKIMRELPMPEEPVRRAVSVHASRGFARRARLRLPAGDFSSRQKARRTRTARLGPRHLTFADGTRAEADAVIGADGVHSLVREIIVGPDEPLHKGRIAYRAVFSSALLNGFDIGRSRTKWWGIDRHIVIYYVTAARSELYFVTSVPEPAGWVTRESWSATGDVRELRKAYEGFHPDVRACSKHAPIVTSGPYSNASRCRIGPAAAWCCSAMPATP